MRVLHIAGFTNSGKTRLIEALIPILPVVEVLKWSHHPLPMDPVATDTGRFQRLGAKSLLASNDGLWGHLTVERAQVYRWLACSLGHDDLLLVEGDKVSPQPKIWMGPIDASITSIVLAIGPTAPASASCPWIASSIPPSTESLRQLTEHFSEHWTEYTYRLSGGFST